MGDVQSGMVGQKVYHNPLVGGDVQSGMVGQTVYHNSLFGSRVRTATYWALVVRVNLKAEKSEEGK